MTKIKKGDMVAFFDEESNKPDDFGIVLGISDQTDFNGEKLYKISWSNYTDKDGSCCSHETAQETRIYRAEYLKWRESDG